jgi:ribA/ribD-fused uncharacterized protein
MNYSKDWLKKQFAESKPVEFLFFWGHKPSKDGTIIKTCMSQWWPVHFDEEGIVYKTAEHYMMVSKAKVFKDNEMIEKIVACETPKEAKAFGRQIANFDAAVWDQHKYQVVVKANVLKFSQNPELKQFLLSTGNTVIVEASPRDLIWGIGLGEHNPKSQNPNTWRGRNLLGFALMEARDELRKQ